MKIQMECLECGAKFRKGGASPFYVVECPKCHSTDVEVAEAVKPVRRIRYGGRTHIMEQQVSR